MYIRNSIFTIAGVSCLMLSPAHLTAGESEQVVLPPSGPWHLDMAENKCRLARFFGPEGEQTILMLDQWHPSRFANFLVSGPAVEDFRPHRKANFSFGPNGDADEFEMLDSTFSEYGTAVMNKSTVSSNNMPEPENDDLEWIANPRSLKNMDSAGAKDITSLTLSQWGRDDVVLQLGSMEEPLKALNTCMEDLVKYWGYDVEKQKTVVTSPKITNREKVANMIQDNYPGKAENKGAQADFHLRLSIDETGKIEDCWLINQTLADDFDMERHPCTFFRKYGEAEPARDSSGNPVKTFYTTRIIYRMRV